MLFQFSHTVITSYSIHYTKLYELGETETALEMIQRDIGPLHERLSKSFDALVKINTENVAVVEKSAGDAFAKTLMITVAAAIVGVLGIGLFGFFVGRSITRPLAVMQKAIIRTATELDFTDTIEVRSRDEVGASLEAYNELLAKLRGSFAERNNFV